MLDRTKQEPRQSSSSEWSTSSPNEDPLRMKRDNPRNNAEATGTAVRPSHPPLLAILDLPVEASRPPRLLVADRHQTERVGGVAGPVVLGAEADVAGLVFALMVKPDGVPARLRRRLVPPYL